MSFFDFEGSSGKAYRFQLAPDIVDQLPDTSGIFIYAKEVADKPYPVIVTAAKDIREKVTELRAAQTLEEAKQYFHAKEFYIKTDCDNIHQDCLDIHKHYKPQIKI